MKEYIGIDIFSGAGGLSYGAKMAGVDIRYAVENNKYAALTFENNHTGAKVITEDIRKVDPIVEFALKEKPFIVMGGPPCQGFSMSNTKTRNDDNPNNQMFREFVRFVNLLEPKWFLFENVWGFYNMNEGGTAEMIANCFEDLGYKVKKQILWASDFGVPQKRNRFIMIGNKADIDFEFPKPIGTKVTVEEAIGDLPVLVNGDNFDSLPYRLPFDEASDYAKMMRGTSSHATQNYVSRNNELVIERYKHIKQGQNWRAIPDELMQNYADKGRCHSGIYKRLRADEPSVVISNYRKSMLIHPTQNRGLSVREAARIQSFPDDFIFHGPIMYIQQQIGNAVPPLLAKAVIEQILSYE